MKYKLLKCENELHLLTCTGEIKIISKEEAYEYIFNYDSVNFEGSVDTEMMRLFEKYQGTLLATLDDNSDLIIHNADFLRELKNMEIFSYYTTAEFAEIHGRALSRVLLLCKTGRIEGAIQKGSTWYIPKNAQYPADRRAGRDMSKRYSKNKD